MAITPWQVLTLHAEEASGVVKVSPQTRLYELAIKDRGVRRLRRTVLVLGGILLVTPLMHHVNSYSQQIQGILTISTWTAGMSVLTLFCAYRLEPFAMLLVFEANCTNSYNAKGCCWTSWFSLAQSNNYCNIFKVFQTLA